MSRVLKRNNVIAGAFLIAGLLLTVAVAFWLGDGADALFARRSEYTFRFSIGDGVAGVDDGSPVTLGGRKVGRVTGMRLSPAEGDTSGVPRFIDVAVEIDAAVRLYGNAMPQVVTPLLGTLATINIPTVGGADGDAPAPALLAEGGLVVGGTAPGLLAQAGLEPDAIRAVVSTARDVLDNARTITGAFATEAEPSAKDVRETVAQFRAFATLLNEKAVGYTERIDEVFVDVKGFTGRLDPLTTKFDTLLDETRDAVGQGESTFATVQRTIDDNRPRIDAALTDAAAIIERFKGSTVDRVDRLVANADDAVTQGRESLGKVNLLLDTETPGIRRTLANVRLVSDRATVFFEEVSAAPWRLLFRPGDKEREEEIIYDAARQYATAVSRLRAASDSLDAALRGVTGTGPSAALDASTLAAMQADLVESFAKYQETEQTLLRAFSERFSDNAPTK